MRYYIYMFLDKNADGKQESDIVYFKETESKEAHLRFRAERKEAKEQGKWSYVALGEEDGIITEDKYKWSRDKAVYHTTMGHTGVGDDIRIDFHGQQTFDVSVRSRLKNDYGILEVELQKDAGHDEENRKVRYYTIKKVREGYTKCLWCNKVWVQGETPTEHDQNSEEICPHCNTHGTTADIDIEEYKTGDQL